MSNLYIRPSIHASYQVSYHLAKRFQRKSCFRNRTIRNKNCLRRPCLLTDQNGMSNSHRGPSFHRCFLPSFGLFGQAVSEKKIFRNWLIRIFFSLWWPCLLTDWDKMSNLNKRTFHRCFLPSFGSFGHVVSEEKIFRNRPIRNKNRLWWPCLLMDWDKMSNLYRGPPIDASYQVSVHLAMWFQRRRFFRNRPIRNKNRLWRPCLLMELERNEYSL